MKSSPEWLQWKKRLQPMPCNAAVSGVLSGAVWGRSCAVSRPAAQRDYSEQREMNHIWRCSMSCCPNQRSAHSLIRRFLWRRRSEVLIVVCNVWVVQLCWRCLRCDTRMTESTRANVMWRKSFNPSAITAVRAHAGDYRALIVLLCYPS